MGEWKEFRELVVVDKVQECPDIISFYFKAKDGGKLAVHQAGQFLPFRVQTENEKHKGVLRTYSLSNYPNEEIYRISVKKIDGGLMSTYLHEQLHIGDIIEAMIPAGLFTISHEIKQTGRPIILLSGGIGITPILSMLYEQMHTDLEMYIIQAVQNSSMHPFKKDIEVIAKKDTVHATVFYSNPLVADVLGEDYDEKGFVTKEWVKDNLPLNAEFYFCGPPPFMKALEKSLIELGVEEASIHYEFFSV